MNKMETRLLVYKLTGIVPARGVRLLVLRVPSKCHMSNVYVSKPDTFHIENEVKDRLFAPDEDIEVLVRNKKNRKLKVDVAVFLYQQVYGVQLL